MGCTLIIDLFFINKNKFCHLLKVLYKWKFKSFLSIQTSLISIYNIAKTIDIYLNIWYFINAIETGILIVLVKYNLTNKT